MERLPVIADPVPGVRDDSRPICFVHIPRTGGSTVKQMMRETFGAQATLIDAHYFTPIPELLRELAFVEGHVGTKFFEQIVGENWHANAFAIVRDPVARTVSQARHIRARPGRYQSELAAPEADPDAVFGRVPRLANLQTKMLSGTPVDVGQVDRAAIDTAKANLDRMAFGLTEDFDVSIALFAERMGLRIERYGVTNNSSDRGDRDLRGAAFRDAAERHNDLDQELYDYAVERFRARVATYVDAMLGLDFAETRLECELFSNGNPIDEIVRVPADRPTIRVAGWILVDGRPADAVIARYGAVTVPVAARIARPDAARRFRDPRNRHAGIFAHISLPSEADSLELIAFDRVRRLRASYEVPTAIGAATRARPLGRLRASAREWRRGRPASDA